MHPCHLPRVQLMPGGLQGSLITILEVFLHDPLLSWKVSDDKALKVQPEDEETGAVAKAGGRKASDSTTDVRNKDARSVLLRVRQKLDGSDTGAPLSVAGQVNHLIQVRWQDYSAERMTRWLVHPCSKSSMPFHVPSPPTDPTPLCTLFWLADCCLRGTH